MTTITISAGAMFTIGLAVGMILGVVGLAVVAVMATKKKNK
jgi:hypothetical protein